MALKLAPSPSGALELIAEALSSISTAGGAPEVLVGVPDASLLRAALPHPVYTLTGSQIAQGRNVRAGQLIGWRFLIQYRSKVVGAAELSCNPLGRNLRFLSFDTGPFAKATRDIVADAERLDAVVSHPYELRLLKAPSVYVMAVWLEDLDGTDDIVIPIAPGAGQPRGVASMMGGAPGPQSPSEFMRGLRPAAKAALDFNRGT